MCVESHRKRVEIIVAVMKSCEQTKGSVFHSMSNFDMQSNVGNVIPRPGEGSCSSEKFLFEKAFYVHKLISIFFHILLM